MNRYTTVFTVFALSLACSGTGGPSDLAVQECTPASDADDCEKCFLTVCQEQCYSCVDDPTCYECTQGDSFDDEACKTNEEVALLLTCVLGSLADCTEECAGAPPPAEPGKPPRIGKGRRGGGEGGRGGGGGGRGGGGGGGGEGKTGKGGKRKGG